MKITELLIKDLPRKLVSVLLATILWFLVVAVQNPEIDREFRNVTVILQDDAGTPSEYGLSVISGEDQVVNVQVRGQRNQIASFSKTDIVAWVEMGGITKAGRYSLPIQILLPDSTLSLIGKQPSSISVWVDKIESANIPVEAVITGNAAEGGYFDGLTLQPKSIVVSGPLSEINRVEKAVIEISLDKFSDSVTQKFSYKLVDKNGDEIFSKYISKATETVTASLVINKSKELALGISIINKPADLTDLYYEAQIVPATVKVSGSDQILASLERLDLGEIDFNEIEQSKEYTFTIEYPPGVKSVDQVRTATVLITLRDLLTRIVSTSNIFLENVPSEVSPQLLTPSLDIRLRGPAELIEKLDQADVRLTVDLKGRIIQPGQYEMQVEVTILGDSGHSIAVLGDYSVVIAIP